MAEQGTDQRNTHETPHQRYVWCRFVFIEAWSGAEGDRGTLILLRQKYIQMGGSWSGSKGSANHRQANFPQLRITCSSRGVRWTFGSTGFHFVYGLDSAGVDGGRRVCSNKCGRLVLSFCVLPRTKAVYPRWWRQCSRQEV
jgi:hypothetical protein